jgi:hypothetical protein
MPNSLAVGTQEVLARAYYGLPLKPEIKEPSDRMKGRTISIRICRRNHWVDDGDAITAEGLRALVIRGVQKAC